MRWNGQGGRAPGRRWGTAQAAEQALNESERGHEEYAVSSLDELMIDCADQVRLAASRKIKGEDVVSTREERSFAERGKHLCDLRRQAGACEGGLALLEWKVGLVEAPLNPS